MQKRVVPRVRPLQMDEQSSSDSNSYRRRHSESETSSLRTPKARLSFHSDDESYSASERSASSSSTSRRPRNSRKGKQEMREDLTRKLQLLDQAWDNEERKKRAVPSNSGPGVSGPGASSFKSKIPKSIQCTLFTIDIFII